MNSWQVAKPCCQGDIRNLAFFHNLSSFVLRVFVLRVFSCEAEQGHASNTLIPSTSFA